MDKGYKQKRGVGLTTGCFGLSNSEEGIVIEMGKTVRKLVWKARSEFSLGHADFDILTKYSGRDVEQAIRIYKCRVQGKGLGLRYE